MSFALVVWDPARPPSVREAADRYERLCREGDPGEPDSPRITAFAEECERRWPDAPGRGPWASWPLRRQGSGYLASIRPAAATEMFGDWAEMAERHGLVLYDPQSGVVKIPSRLSYDAQPPAPTRGRFGRR